MRLVYEQYSEHSPLSSESVSNNNRMRDQNDDYDDTHIHIIPFKNVLQ